MSLLPRNPKPGTAFCRYNGRLALFHEAKNNVKYWREYWSDEKRAELTKQAKMGELYDYDAPVRREYCK